MARTRLLAACVVFAIHLFSQETTIRTTVPLVQLPASVTDKSGQFAYGLTAKDFVVTDEGRAVPVHVDDPDSVSAPLAVVVLVQVTDISDSALLKIKKIGSMIGGAVVGANGFAAVVTYADEVTVVQPLTTDEDAISTAFHNLKSVATRNGHMIDAVEKALELLGNRAASARSAIVIIGESKDRGSKTALSRILPALENSGATVYCLEYSAFLTPFTTKASEYSPPGGGRGLLDAITETVHATTKDTGKILTASTGGRALNFQTKSKLENDLIRLGAEVHSRYLISFTPAASPQEKFHSITVQVRDRPDLIVHVRPGYWPKTQ